VRFLWKKIFVKRFFCIVILIEKDINKILERNDKIVF